MLSRFGIKAVQTTYTIAVASAGGGVRAGELTRRRAVINLMSTVLVLPKPPQPGNAFMIGLLRLHDYKTSVDSGLIHDNLSRRCL